MQLLLLYHLSFLKWPVTLNHLLIGAASLGVLFHSSKYYCAIDIRVADCINFLWSSHWNIFFNNALPTLLKILRVLSFESMSISNVIFYGIPRNGIISWAMWDFNISIVVWISNIWFAYLGYIFSLTFEG